MKEQKISTTCFVTFVGLLKYILKRKDFLVKMWKKTSKEEKLHGRRPLYKINVNSWISAYVFLKHL
jgi:hypothetical protein